MKPSFFHTIWGAAVRLPLPVRHIAVVIGLLCVVINTTFQIDAQNREIPARLTPEIRKMLADVDSLLLKFPEIIKEKEGRIDSYLRKLDATGNMEQRYWLQSSLYDEYSAYDSDLAMKYADEALATAQSLGRSDLESEMKLNKVYLLSATGFLEKASAVIDSIDPASLSPELALKYCDRMLFLSTHQDLYMGVEYEMGMYSQMADSILHVMTKDLKREDSGYYWLTGWSSLNNRKKASEAIPLLKKNVESSDNCTRDFAMMSWVLAKLYELTGDRQNYLKFLLVSAMADIRACNKEIASLEEAARILYQLDDLDHANQYVNFCIACANEYKSRVRTGNLARLQKDILQGIQERSERQIRINHIYLVLLIVIIVIINASIFYIMRQNRLLKQSRATLNEANSELNEKVQELSGIRVQLNEANEKLHEMYQKARASARELAEVNEEKERHIADMFAICSNYINKMDEFRLNIHRLLVDKKFDKVIDIVKSPELSYDEIRELYETFDEIFLKIYPHFVDDFNTLLRPEEHIKLRNPKKLTTELRIYALVRLGLNDSVKIAKFLHCSVQTVYNTRQRTRNKAAAGREHFAEAVAKLGKIDG
ncbi:MAG: transcriptional regulator [Muribaculaceae bacterium]|nr:transcriptional regulator [Muribaculaceae bacterium]